MAIYLPCLSYVTWVVPTSPARWFSGPAWTPAGSKVAAMPQMGCRLFDWTRHSHCTTDISARARARTVMPGSNLGPRPVSSSTSRIVSGVRHSSV